MIRSPLPDAEPCPAFLTIVVAIAARQDVLKLGQRMRHVDVMRSQEQARSLTLGYRVLHYARITG